MLVNIRSATITGLATLVLAGCATQQPEAVADGADEALEHCGAVRYLDRVGNPLTSMMGPMGTSARVFMGDVPDEDGELLERLNVQVDENNNVIRVWCG